jgi:two-component system cell cycle sensor histidine kinase/response regulator CckA
MDVSTALPTFTASARDSYRDLRFPQVFEAAAIGIALCHLDGRILEGNSALARLLGYDLPELAGLDPWKFHQIECPSGSRLLADLVGGARESFAVERSCRRKDATEFTGRLTVSLAHDSRRDPAFLVVMLEDLTERTRLEQQLKQAEKMELMGRLAAGVAHDFNNLLTGFLIYCDLLLTKLEPGNPMHREVEEMRQAGEHGSALTQQLLEITRKKSPGPRHVSLNQIVSSSENLLRHLIGGQIEFVISLDPAAGTVFADPARLRQVLLNLALNSRDAIPEQGTIHLRTKATEFRDDLRIHLRRPAVSLIVEDDGSGMTAEVRTRLFEPFFTTKIAGRGTGMGLPTVRRIVDEAGGQIEVASEPGRGTRIEILFPASKNGQESLSEPSEVQNISSHESHGDTPC